MRLNDRLYNRLMGGVYHSISVSGYGDIAPLNRPGPRLAFVPCVHAVLLMAFGLPELVSGQMAPDKFRIELGEYSDISGLIAVFIIGSLLPLRTSLDDIAIGSRQGS